MSPATRWCPAMLAPLASTFLAAAALAQDTGAGANLRIAALDHGERVARAVLAPHSCADAEQTPTSKTLDIARAATLCLLNAERALRGRAPLVEHPLVTQVTQAYSQWMVDERYFAHGGLLGYLDRTYWMAGQNLAWADGALAAPAHIVEGWMGSTGHRSNILDPAFGVVGIGIAPGSPEPRSRLVAATYTTDFAVVAGGPVTTASPTRRGTAGSRARHRRCASPKRAAKRAVDGARRDRSRCRRRSARLEALLQ